MRDTLKHKRRLLTAGLGIAAYTAFEGLACGNPIEPRCPDPGGCPDARVDASPSDASDAPVLDADIDAAVDADEGDVDAQAATLAPDDKP
jgi:hypothetical protein